MDSNTSIFILSLLKKYVPLALEKVELSMLWSHEEPAHFRHRAKMAGVVIDHRSNSWLVLAEKRRIPVCSVVLVFAGWADLLGRSNKDKPGASVQRYCQGHWRTLVMSGTGHGDIRNEAEVTPAFSYPCSWETLAVGVGIRFNHAC